MGEDWILLFDVYYSFLDVVDTDPVLDFSDVCAGCLSNWKFERLGGPIWVFPNGIL